MRAAADTPPARWAFAAAYKRSASGAGAEARWCIRTCCHRQESSRRATPAAWLNAPKAGEAETTGESSFAAHRQRVPGPRRSAICLQRDAELQAAGMSPPRSTLAVWEVLRGTHATRRADGRPT